MGHRHTHNPFNAFEMDRVDNQNYVAAGQSYAHMGSAGAPAYGSLVHPVDNMIIGRVNCDSHWNSESRAHEYPSTTFSRELQHVRPAFTAAPYADPSPQSSAVRNMYLTPENNPGHVYSNYYSGHPGHEINSGNLDHVMGGTGRGSFKRKSPGVNVSYERGSSRCYYGAGSSSGSSELLLEKAPMHGQSIVPMGHHNGLPHYMGGSNLPFGGEGSSRNVRSRPRLELIARPMTTCVSSYSSRHYHSTTRPGTVEPFYTNADEIRGYNFVPMPPASHDTNGLSHTNHQFFANGGPTNVGVSGHGSVHNSRNPILPLRCFNGGPPVQAVAREVGGNNPPRGGGGVISSSSMAGPSHTSLGHRAAAYSEHVITSDSETTYSSRNPRSSLGEGWHHGYRNGRSRIAVNRFQSVSGMVDAHGRTGSRGLSMVDHSSLYSDSRNLFDQYRDMRLDVDNMSYEELLALEERIGNVNTGLCEDKISESLSENVYYSSDQNHEDGICVICLEEYVSKEEVGTVKKCGHGYHASCIRKWLSMKNVCPICKSPALKDC